ncbi:MAG: serine/threonine protein kinase [Proteobacteria bacterium]|nr:serine/threonine protein kinase [Pseudomonadota bacterium]
MEQLKAYSVEDSDAAGESYASEHIQSENCSFHKAEGGMTSSSGEDVDNLALKHPELAKVYHDIEKIAKGSQGTMLRAKDAGDHDVAIKVFDIGEADSLKSIELFEREINTIKSLHFKGVPEYIDTIKSDRYIYLIEEYIPAPSLEKRMKNGDRYSFEQIETILIHGAQILRELAACVPPVIHRDIKPANLLVDDDLNVFLVDFGVVASIAQNSTAMTFAGTAGYLAPEQLYGRVTPAADVFGLGMTMIHLISGVSPCDIKMNGTEFDLESCISPKIPAWFVSVLKEMTCWDTSMRLKDGQAVLDSITFKKTTGVLTENSRLKKIEAIWDTVPEDVSGQKNSNDQNASEQTESPSEALSTMKYKAEKILKPAYDSFDARLSNYNMSIGWVPLFITFFVFLAFLLFGVGLLRQEFSAFLSSWMPVCLPFIFGFAALCTAEEITPSARSYSGNREKYIENAQTINELCRKAILDLKNFHDLFKYDDVFARLSRQVNNFYLFWKPESKALSPEENERLDAYLNDESVVYPCVLYEPSLGNIDVVLSISFILTLAVLGLSFGLIPYMANLSFSSFWGIAYYFANALVLSIVVKDFINILRSHKKRMTDPRNIDAYKLYVRRFLNECLEQKKLQESAQKDK